jgi:hypothetical protein
VVNPAEIRRLGAYLVDGEPPVTLEELAQREYRTLRAAKLTPRHFARRLEEIERRSLAVDRDLDQLTTNREDAA